MRCKTILFALTGFVGLSASLRAQPGPGIDAQIESAALLANSNQLTEAAATLKGILPPSGQDDSPDWPIAEDSFKRAVALSKKLMSANKFSPGTHAKLLRVQMRGYLRSFEGSEGDEKEVWYQRWSGLRLKYLREVWLGRERWDTAASFRTEGVEQGLRRFDIARESFWSNSERAVHAQFKDSVRDNENQYWIDVVKDRVSSAAERERLRALWSSGDPAAKAAEAALIKRAFNGNVVNHPAWRAHDQFFDAAVADLTAEFEQAQSSDQRTNASRDAIQLALRAEALFRWPPTPLAPQVTTALAFKDRLPSAADRLWMDAINALALAQRGMRTDALTLHQSITSQLAELVDISGGTKWEVERLLQQVTRITSSSVEVPAGSSAGDLLPTTMPSETRYKEYLKIAVELCADTAVQTSSRDAAHEALRAAALACLNLGLPSRALEICERVGDRIGLQAPRSKRLSVLATKMVVLSWNSRTDEALRIADQISDQVDDSESWDAALAVDALCHAYAYSEMYLHNSALGQRYLTKVRAQFPGAESEKLIATFEQLVANSRR